MLILRDCMSSPVVSVPEGATVKEAAQIMADREISSILIQGNEDFLGVFTTTDLVKRVVAAGLDPNTTSALSVATFPILTIDQYLTPEEANEKMLRHKVKRVAVTEGKKIVGIISMKDIVRL
ncbi:MAG: CBS domain-containing protein [Nitrospinota bacterium]|nr:CBS domain-containing protein [Nitrospinota bacterium]